MTRFLAWVFSIISIGAIFGLGAMAVMVWHYGNDLPSHEKLENYQPATLSRVYDRDGAVMAEYLTERRVFAPVDEIPDLVKNAFIAAEDRNFYDHHGFDAVGIVGAVVDYVKGGRLRGASTITQQVMKNFLLTNERSFDRKFKEIILATRMEQVLSKDQILELYLNEIYLGARAYGVVAAAANYFGRPLEHLSVAQAAYLAALPKAPSNLHPVNDREAALDRRGYVLSQMLRAGFITDAQYDEAMKEPLDTILDGSLEPEIPPVPARDYFSEEIRRQLVDRLGEDEVEGGGLTIRATLDPKLQRIGADALRDRLVEWDKTRQGWRGPVAKIDPAELEGGETAWRRALSAQRAPADIPGWYPAVVLEVGETTARIGVEGVAEDEDGHYVGIADAGWAKPELQGGGVGRAPRKPSDIFEVGDVIMVAAEDAEGAEMRDVPADQLLTAGLDSWSLRQIPEIEGAFMAMDPTTGRVLAMQGGFSFETSVFNRASQAKRQPGSSFKPFVYAAALDNGYTPSSVILDAPIAIDTGSDELWRPENSSRKFYGPSPMRVGIEQSRNVMTVRLAQEIGMDRVAEYAERFGVYKNMPHHLSYALGAGETTLYQMVGAYGMFANGGWRIEPTLVDRVQDRYGETLFKQDNRACYECTEIWEAGLQEPVPTPDKKLIMDPVTAFQLTSMMRGTVERGTATTLASLGIPMAAKTGTTNDARDAWLIAFTPNMVAGCYIGYDNPRPMGRGAYGATMCGPVIKAFMAEAMKDRPHLDFHVPPGAVMAKIDRGSGRRLSDDASGPGVVVEAFHPGEEPQIGEYSGGRVIDGGFVAYKGGDLPMSLDASADSGGAYGGGASPSAAGAASRPAPPKPSSGGFGSGGLY
ncbi:penicillin-binding protein 1A [Albimonas sp. CAU 1670]|uniref:penicillin-binding protein 1A n=1 Tax=Albimonas sp. CAU 1670 TaxID=3032599 RepID=UPI0023D9FA37|nr:penicillin-binding protein 1A [Albimonas sp. CAU 1670]MDF2232538.1 penicillin-binding protein 1A [Albimonas sp. CAU 1670]